MIAASFRPSAIPAVARSANRPEAPNLSDGGMQRMICQVHPEINTQMYVKGMAVD